MTREQKIERTRELRAEGLTYREIGERLGLTTRIARYYAKVAKVYDRKCATCGEPFEPEHGKELTCSPECWRVAEDARKRAWDRAHPKAHKTECPQCGGEMERATARRSGICQACHEDEVDRRARQIERWWAEGLLLKEIASRLGWSLGHIAQEFDRLRAKGYNLPHRYRVSNGKRVAA